MAKKEQVCANCGFKGAPKKVTKGSIFIEIVAWIAFIFPGIIYSIWRMTSKTLNCPSCGSINLVPLDSPRAKQLLKEFGAA